MGSPGGDGFGALGSLRLGRSPSRPQPVAAAGDTPLSTADPGPEGVVRAHAHPRVGLLGNPGDLYGQRGSGFTFDAFRATVELHPAPALDLGAGDPATAPMAELFEAGWEVFRRWAQVVGEPDGPTTTTDEPPPRDAPTLDATDGRPARAVRPFAVRATTDIPRQVGLSGSSALIVALLRALTRWCALRLPPHRLAQLAWRAEQDVLGIRAGPQDRLVQAHGGLVTMDWAEPWQPWSTRRRAPALLPELLLAHDREVGASSGAVHSDVYERWLAGDRAVEDKVVGFGPLADFGFAALERGETDAFASFVEANVLLRQELFTLGEADLARLATAGRHDAGAKLAGSGGAVLVAPRTSTDTDALTRELEAGGSTVLRPRVAAPADGVEPVDPPPRLAVVLLAAGFATRLEPLTERRAKPLLAVGGSPPLTRLVRQLAATGAASEIVVVHNRRFADEFARWQELLAYERVPPVRLVDNGVEDKADLRGAVADLALALERAPPAASEHGPVDGYLVAAGDNLLDGSLDGLVARFAGAGRCREPVLLVRRLPEPVPPRTYSEVVLGEDGRVTSFREKPPEVVSPLSAVPVYALPPELPDLLAQYLARPGAERDAPGHLLAWLCERGPVHGELLGGRSFDIGNPEALDAARAWCALVEGPHPPAPPPRLHETLGPTDWRDPYDDEGRREHPPRPRAPA